MKRLNNAELKMRIAELLWIEGDIQAQIDECGEADGELILDRNDLIRELANDNASEKELKDYVSIAISIMNECDDIGETGALMEKTMADLLAGVHNINTASIKRIRELEQEYKYVNAEDLIIRKDFFMLAPEVIVIPNDAPSIDKIGMMASIMPFAPVSQAAMMKPKAPSFIVPPALRFSDYSNNARGTRF